MQKILIAGYGFLGKELHTLLKKDYQVWTLSRQAQAPGNRNFHVQADLTDKESLQQLPNDFDFLFYLAAAKEHSEKVYRDVYILGLRNILERLNTSHAFKCAFFSSSTSVYADQNESWVDEESPTTAEYFSGKIMLEAESLVKELSPKSCSVRFSGLYGKERNSLAKSVLDGSAKLSKNEHLTNRIHISDAARMLAHLLALESRDALYIGSDSHPSPKNEVLLHLAERLRVVLKEEVTEDGSTRGLRSNKKCSNEKIKKSGFEFLYPSYKEGYEEVIEKLSS